MEPGAGGHVYAAAAEMHQVKVFTKSGASVRTLGTGVRGAGNNQFASPLCVRAEPGPDGHIYVSDLGNYRIQIFNKEGAHVRTIGVTGQRGSGNHQFDTPWGLCVEPGAAGHLYVTDTNNHRVQVFNKAGAYVRTIGVTGQQGTGTHQLDRPEGVAVEPGPDGLVYVTDYGNDRLLVFMKV